MSNAFLVLRPTTERDTGIEPALQPWEGCVLPLYESRFLFFQLNALLDPCETRK